MSKRRSAVARNGTVRGVGRDGLDGAGGTVALSHTGAGGAGSGHGPDSSSGQEQHPPRLHADGRRPDGGQQPRGRAHEHPVAGRWHAGVRGAEAGRRPREWSRCSTWTAPPSASWARHGSRLRRDQRLQALPRVAPARRDPPRSVGTGSEVAAHENASAPRRSRPRPACPDGRLRLPASADAASSATPPEQESTRLEADGQHRDQPYAPEQGHRSSRDHRMLGGEVQEQHHAEGHAERDAGVTVHQGLMFPILPACGPDRDAHGEQHHQEMERLVGRHRESGDPDLMNSVDDRRCRCALDDCS